jgi:uncharacterized membrane protein
MYNIYSARSPHQLQSLLCSHEQTPKELMLVKIIVLVAVVVIVIIVIIVIVISRVVALCVAVMLIFFRW